MSEGTGHAGTVTVRFDGDLATFVRAGGGGRSTRVVDVPTGGLTLRTAVDDSATVKDVVERLGVPHTEVLAVTVNGPFAEHSCKLEPGDVVHVFPWDSPEAVPPEAVLLPAPPPEPRFVADGHLGTLARRLRLCGFDTWYDNEADDARLATLAAREERILLTRDTGLLKRRIVRHGYKPRSTDPFAQTVEVLRRYDLADRMQPFTRCQRCNGLLEPVAKTDVLDRLEPGTRRDHDRFSWCTHCGRVYWRGSHFDRLVGLVGDLRRAASA